MTYIKYSAWILIILVTVSSFAQSQGQSRSPVEIRISTINSEYFLGQPVELGRIDVKMGGAPVGFIGDDLRFFIARNGDEFKRYTFAAWGLPENFIWLGPYKVGRSIFLNKKPVIDHLSEYARGEAEDGMILTDYAFPEPGEYRIKATLVFTAKPGTDRFPDQETIDSNEVSITVKELEGDNLRVWEIMKADPRIGFFMVEGEAPYEVPSVREIVLAKVDRIVSEYPNSFLARLLRVKAQEHRRRERIRQEAEQERLKREKAASASRIN